MHRRWRRSLAQLRHTSLAEEERLVWKSSLWKNVLCRREVFNLGIDTGLRLSIREVKDKLTEISLATCSICLCSP